MPDGLLSAEEWSILVRDMRREWPEACAVIERQFAALEAKHARELEFARHEKCPVCGDQGCTNCSVELLRKDHATTLAAIRAELEKLPHEALCHYDSECKCARGRALKLAGGQE